ncbi:hypothetical protein [Actinopolyspora lacussalsi]|uniref:hypothetical protein n=1 Tax=Actinopolyspora righensis TaxID=995060 RepID=UPI000B847CAC|nr:hypothetical protein [Actinopolyspora righensis]
MANLLSPECLPEGFTYPREFVRVVELGLTDLEPWSILEGRRLVEHFAGLRKRYPDRNVIPFAHRIDNDDVACWDLDRDARVVIVHDFASPGWERQGEYEGFYDWLRQAVEDLIEYDN